jgi:adenine-specific DNA methylase
MDFIADFSDWKNARRKEFIVTAQALTNAAHMALQENHESRPLVLDPFAGGGSIPIEALRVGADVFASDLNPIPVLLNKVLVEFIPRHGIELRRLLCQEGDRIGNLAKKLLSPFYPQMSQGCTPIAYLWAKTLRCEGPGCGVEIPILRSLWLEKKGASAAYLDLKIARAESSSIIETEVVCVQNGRKPRDGTVKRGSVECPACSYVISRARVQEIAQSGNLGERLIAVVSTKSGNKGRVYRSPNDREIDAMELAAKKLSEFQPDTFEGISVIPDEDLPYLRSIFNVHVYGVRKWASLFNERQLIACLTFARLVRESKEFLLSRGESEELAEAVCILLALTADRQINALNRTCYWNSTGAKMQAGFARQAIPMFWDYCEANPFGGSVGSWDSMVRCVLQSFDALSGVTRPGTAQCASATDHPLPDDSVDAVITDPPYYDAVPYADLSDFFYVWLRRMVGSLYPNLFASDLSPKELEIVQLAERNPKYAYKTRKKYESLMTCALAECRRIAKHDSVSVVVFAHQRTAGWEAMLSSLIQAGWVVTASWPIDTEMPTRVRASNSAVLASSIHLTCRPRETASGDLITDKIGDWRDVLDELPRRIHAWLPRLAEERVVGADAIFACLGPALEIYSRYSSVEKASGRKVTLKEYLEEVWAAIAREALSMIFEGADASGFDEDARLTAMWLWTLRTEANVIDEAVQEGEFKSMSGYNLEYDAARKIAQGLGAHLENLSHLVEIKGETATLLSAGARIRYLFGKDTAYVPKGRKKKLDKQMKLTFEEELKGLEEEPKDWAGELSGRAESTVLDQLHQCMVLFGVGRSEAMRRFLVDDAIGRNPLFWRLAQALSALYPIGTDEKRWVDGVLARKKGLGF